MARTCEVCGKTVSFGKQITTRGLPKRTGGVGIKITGISPRKFIPNLQRIRVAVGGGVQRKTVCTRCIKNGRVKKAG